MPDSIKKQILARIQANLEAIGSGGDNSFKHVARRLDPMQRSSVMPSLFWFVGPEQEVGKDNQGRTYRFPVVLKLMFKGLDKLDQHADLVAAVQDVMEGDIQLNALANVVDGGTEEPFLDEGVSDQGGSLMVYTVQYRRVRGAADETY